MAIVLIAVQVLTAAGLIVYRHLYDRRILTRGTETVFALDSLTVEKSASADARDRVTVTLFLEGFYWYDKKYSLLTEGGNGTTVAGEADEAPYDAPYLENERLFRRNTVVCQAEEVLSVFPLAPGQNWRSFESYNDWTGARYRSGQIMIGGTLHTVQARGYVYRGDVVFTAILIDGETAVELQQDSLSGR